MNIEVLARRAQAKWGTASQLDMVVEECAELIDAIQKSKRERKNWEDVLSEAVDVEIMIEQIKVILENPTLWQNVRQEKIARLEGLLKGQPR